MLYVYPKHTTWLRRYLCPATNEQLTLDKIEQFKTKHALTS